MIAPSVHTLMLRSSEEQVERALKDQTAFSWVDWREDDDQIPGLCEAILRTGDLRADWDDQDNLFIVRKGVRVPVRQTTLVSKSITDSWLFYSLSWALPSFITDSMEWPRRGDRHTTLLAITRALHPEYEIRFVSDSADDGELAFVALTAADWLALEEQYGADVVGRTFAPICEQPNLFLQNLPNPGQ